MESAVQFTPEHFPGGLFVAQFSEKKLAQHVVHGTKPANKEAVREMQAKHQRDMKKKTSIGEMMLAMK